MCAAEAAAGARRHILKSVGLLSTFAIALGFLSFSIKLRQAAQVDARLIASLMSERERDHLELERRQRVLAEQQSELVRLNLLIKQLAREKELADMKRQYFERGSHGTYAGPLRKSDYQRKKIFERCQLADNPLCGIQ